MTEPMLLCMYGLPRSGKSTICATLRMNLGAPVVNRDSIRLALHGARYLPKPEPYVKAISFTMIEALFLAGHPLVICDETCYSQAARNALKSEAWTTVFHEVPTDPETCKARALMTDQPDLVDVIDQMWARREPLSANDDCAILVMDEWGTRYTGVAIAAKA